MRRSPRNAPIRSRPGSIRSTRNRKCAGTGGRVAQRRRPRRPPGIEHLRRAACRMPRADRPRRSPHRSRRRDFMCGERGATHPDGPYVDLHASCASPGRWAARATRRRTSAERGKVEPRRGDFRVGGRVDAEGRSMVRRTGPTLRRRAAGQGASARRGVSRFVGSGSGLRADRRRWDGPRRVKGRRAQAHP